MKIFKSIKTAMSLNDPNWGNKSNDGPRNGNNNNEGGRRPGGGNGGPPDLDEILRKLGQKLSGLFGGNKNGNQNQNPNPYGGGPNGSGGGGMGAGGTAALSGLFFAGIGVLVIGWLSTGFYTVKEGSKAAVLRLGKFDRSTDAGLHWRWPRPIETHEVIDTSNIRTVTIGYRNNTTSKENRLVAESQMLTEDENIVDVQFSLQYDVSDLKDYLFQNNMRQREEEIVRQIGETAIREVIGKNKMDSVLNEGRGEIAANVKTLVQQIADRYKLGILIRSVNLANLQPPDQVQAAFDDFIRAGQVRESLKNEGIAYREDRLPRARGTAQRLLEEAEAHRGRVVANAEGEAARFKQVLVEYEKAPQVVRERLYIESMQQVLSNTSKVFVDSKSGNNLLYLPLDKLIQQTLSDQNPSAKSSIEVVGQQQINPNLSVNTQPPPASAPDANRRDQLRNR
jgi:modulator of FtsH protease HflK